MPGATITPASPSPPPQPPVAQAPGPRATALQKVFNDALAHTLKVCSYDNFASCFPTPARYQEPTLRGVWKSMVGRVEELAKTEFEDILQERNVVPNLNELDRLIEEAKRRRAKAAEGGAAPVPPHTLPPQQLYLAHLQPFLKQQQSQLNAKLQTTQSQNATLLTEVEEQRREIERLVSRLEGVVGDIEEAGRKLGEVVDEGTLRREVVEVEALLRDRE